MEPFGSILGALGSIASLVSLVALWKKGQGWALRLALCAIFGLTGFSAVLSFRYFQATRPEAIRLAKQVALRGSVKEFLRSNSIDASYWSPGQNEGIVKSGLILLEMNKDLFPDSYSRIRADIDADIAFAQQHRDSQEQRVAMDVAAKNMLTLLKALAGDS